MSRKTIVSNVWADGIKYETVKEASLAVGVERSWLQVKIRKTAPGVKFMIKGHRFYYHLKPGETIAPGAPVPHKALLRSPEDEDAHEQALKREYERDAADQVYDELSRKLCDAIARIHTLETEIRNIKKADKALKIALAALRKWSVE